MKGFSFEDKIVKFCRRIFKNKYQEYWIDTLNREVEEVRSKYKLVEVDLYPRTVHLRDELKKRGVTPPPRLNMRKPKKPQESNFKNKRMYKKALRKYKTKLEEYKKLKKQNDKEWKKYSSIVYSIIHEDIEQSKNNNVVPIKINIKKVGGKKKRHVIKELQEKKKKGILLLSFKL